MRVLMLMTLVVLGLVMDVEARPRRRARSNYSYASSGYSSYGSPQAAAESKASIQAQRGACFHPGGGFGGGNAEGVGAGMSPSAALNNCCFTGARTVAGSAVVRGANGMWYACKIYW